MQFQFPNVKHYSYWENQEVWNYSGTNKLHNVFMFLLHPSSNPLSHNLDKSIVNVISFVKNSNY